MLHLGPEYRQDEPPPPTPTPSYPRRYVACVASLSYQHHSHEAPLFSRLDRLAVYDGCAGGRASALCLSDVGPKGIMDSFPRSIQCPPTNLYQFSRCLRHVADISSNPLWIPAPVSGHGAGSRVGARGRLPYRGTGHAFARMTARQLWRPPVGMLTRVIQVPWGRRLYEIELICIKLYESITSWAEKFFQKTCPSRPRQSWTERGPALRSGALSRNQSCPLSAPCAPVEAVSSTICIRLSSLRAVNCCAIIVRAVVRVKRWCAYEPVLI